MPNLQRQISYHLVRGNVKSAVPAAREWDFEDVDDRYILNIGEGEVTGGSRLIPANGGSFSLPLPPDYDNTQPLVCFVSAFGIVKVTFTKTNALQGAFLLKGTNEREATSYFSEYISSVLISNPSPDDVFIRYFLWQQPDLETSQAYRGGALYFGAFTNA